MGIGNELNGDDAAGVLAVRLLRSQIEECAEGQGRDFREEGSSFITANALVIEAGLAPENFTGVLRRFQPDLIFLLDAAWMGQVPGTVAILDADQAGGFGASTHLQPLATLASYLRAELNCDIVLIGIQPSHLEFGVPVSTPVQQACADLAEELAEIMRR